MNANQFVKTSKLLSGKFARENLLDGEVFTINKTEAMKFKDGSEKLTVFLDEAEEALPLNNTNTKILIEAFGVETDLWKGRQFALLVVDREVQGEMKDSIVLKPVREEGDNPLTPIDYMEVA